MIYGERVRQVRELLELTQDELAQLLNLNQPTVAYIESGRVPPSNEVVELIALRTGFPPSFFSQPPDDDFPVGSLLFRGKASRSSKAERRAHRSAQLGFYLLTRLMRGVKPLPVTIPTLDYDPSTSAMTTRVAMGLSPDKPIPHLLNVIERAGVLVIALPIEVEGIDAFSVWTGTQQPIIAISRSKDIARMRWSVAHELAHLVMHRSFPGHDLQTLEHEANLFAGEFLVPEVSAREELTAPLTLSSLALQKPRWRVSMQALAMIAYHLGIITPRQRTSLFQQLTMKGWRLKEPIDVPEERPAALLQLATMAYGSPINYSRLASDVSLLPSFARSYIEACQPPPPTDDSGKVVQFDQPRRQQAV